MITSGTTILIRTCEKGYVYLKRIWNHEELPPKRLTHILKNWNDV